MMDELILRQDAIDSVMGTEPVFSLNSLEPYQKTSDVILALEKLPSAQKWIPCSERLPEKYGEYYVTWTCDNCKRPLIEIIECEETSEFDYDNCGFKMEWLYSETMKSYGNPKVIAWMELPEPYKAESEDKE